MAQKLPNIVHLNVGGHFFTTRLSTLLKDKDSMLAAMFSGRFKLEVDDQGRYFIDRDGKYFGYVLNYLRDASLLPEASVALQVYREAQYFRVEELIRQLERYPCVIPYVVLEEQKKKLTEEKYQHWKSVLLETTQRKYSQVVNSSVGHDCVVVMTRYTSKSDYELGDSICKSHTSACKHKENCNEHRFFSVDESGEVVQHYIGSDLPLVDFVVPDEDIADCRLFTSLVEKDLRVEGFCVSGSFSHSWRCLKCDVTGFLHQMAFRMYLPSLAKIIENDPGTN